MGRMSDEAIIALYEYGKKVYNGETNENTAAIAVNNHYPEVAVSSARHYILWYTKLRQGEFLTWNTNSKLLAYYVEKVIQEEGKETGKVAIASARKFAEFKNKKDLDIAIDNLVKKYEISEKEEQNEWWPSPHQYSPCLTKETWIELLKNNHVFTIDSLQIMAMFYDCKGQAGCKELAQKYGNTHGYYRSVCTHLAERVAKETNCPLFNEKNSKWWPVLFIGRNTQSNEAGDFIWKLRRELYGALTDFDILKFLPVGGEEELSNKEINEKVKQYILSKGFYYGDGLIENFYLSLKSKPFVILAGTSGTGKTRLVRLFAESLGATTGNGKYKLVSVRPDWSDSSDLFGHMDLNSEFVEGAITSFVAEAEQNKKQPYFLCLDEMNLARVEYYLSDILSIMETRDVKNEEIVTDKIRLVGHEDLGLPENLYIIGTVNMDETTFPFSKKVLDRANTIEFSYVDLIPDFNSSNEEVEPFTSVKNDFLKTEYLYLHNCNDEEKAEAKDICNELQAINMILQKANAHIGYRVRDEIVFYMLNNKNMDLLDKQVAFDNEILQKILPRIQGSSSAVRDMLCELFKFCAGDYDGYRTDSGEVSKKMFNVFDNGNQTVKYPKSAMKLAYMMRRYEEDGFTSYWL